MELELRLVEQRYKAVCEVLDGGSVVDVARRNGVARQTVHDWLRAYAVRGLAGLADGSSKPGRRGVCEAGASTCTDIHARWARDRAAIGQ